MTEHEHDVPPRPAFVLQVRNDANGVPTAWLDDEQITVPPGVGIHRALIRAARRRADRTQPGDTIRVAGMTQDGATFHLAIGPDGEAWEVPPPRADNGSTAATSGAVAGGAVAGGAVAGGAVAGDPVPDDITHVIELQEHGDRLVGLVDDDEIPLTRGEDPYEELLREARVRADAHNRGKTVRVLGRTPDGRVWHIALAPDGTPQVIAPAHAPATSKIPPAHPAAAAAAPVNAFRPAAPPDEPEPQPAYIDHELDHETGHELDHEPEGDGTEGLRPTAALTDDLGRPIPTTTTLTSARHDFDTAAETEPAADEEDFQRDEAAAPEEGRDGPSRRTLLLGGAGALVLAGAAAAGFFAFRDDDSTPGPTPAVTGTPLPDGIRSPAGLPMSYLWSVVKLSDVSPQLAVSEAQLVCTVDNDTTGGIQLLALDAHTGKTRWKADLPVDAVVSHGPALVPVDGTDAILLSTQTQLLAYPIDGGDPKTWPLGPKWSVALTRSGVIVTKPDDKASAVILHGDKLTQRALPKGANPVALLTDGTLVATDAHGRVWFSKDATTAPEPEQLKAPEATTPGTFVAATGDQLITAFVPDDDPAASLLRAFSLPQLRPRITTAPVKPAVFPSNFMLAPDESWAVGGNVWVDMTTGDSHVITGQWSPIAISQQNCWSMSGDNVLTATDQGKSLGPAKKTTGQVTIPRGGTSKVAFCVASIGSDTTLYAVPLKE